MTTSSASTTSPLPPLDAPVWLQVGTVFDGLTPTPWRDAHVVFDAERIHYLGTSDRPPTPAILRPGQTAPDRQLPEHCLLPGLTDAHTHLFLAGAELDVDRRAAYLQRAPEELLAEALTRLQPLVELGITAVRDAGDRHGVGLALSRTYRNPGRPIMPYLDSPGAAIHHQGRYGSFMGEALEQYASPAECVAARVAAGADRIKLIPTGIINFKQGAVTSRPQMDTAEVAALVAAARAHGRQTFAHASGADGIEHAIAGGVDSVEHGFFIREDQLARLRDHDIAWVPTFAPVQAQLTHAERLGWDQPVRDHLQRILDQHAAALLRGHALGVRIIAGSDAGSYGVPHGWGLLDELEAMERAGLPAWAVLQAATGVPTARLAFSDRFGRIAPGYRSRLILTRHSPLTSIRHLRRPHTVIFDGNVYENGASVSSAGL